MDSFIKKVEVRWADLDPNFHLRHSVYYDYCASLRIDYLQEKGISAQYMQSHFLGPVILREECVFKKEIRSGDIITVDLTLLKAKSDYSRWSIRHQIFKNEDTLSAILTIDAAWMDTVKRKLVVPPEEVIGTFIAMPKDLQFEWLIKK